MSDALMCSYCGRVFDSKSWAGLRLVSAKPAPDSDPGMLLLEERECRCGEHIQCEVDPDTGELWAPGESAPPPSCETCDGDGMVSHHYFPDHEIPCKECT